MTARDFAYWLQGFFEIAAANGGNTPTLTPSQVALVQKHLALVFVHDIDPQAGGPTVQNALNAIHNTPQSTFPHGGGVVARC